MAPHAKDFLTFYDVSREEVQNLRKLKNRTDQRTILAKALGVKLEEGVSAEILLEFHLQNYLFCEMVPTLATPEKISTLLSIMRVVHEESVAMQVLPQADSIRCLKGQLERHGKQTPPFAVGVFTAEDQERILDYMSKTFYAHYKMYQYVYKRRRDLDLQAMPEDLAPPIPVVVRSLRPIDEVDPREQPELAFLFKKEREEKERREMEREAQRGSESERTKTRGELEAEAKIEDAINAFDTSIRASDDKLEKLLSGA